MRDGRKMGEEGRKAGERERSREKRRERAREVEVRWRNGRRKGK